MYGPAFQSRFSAGIRRGWETFSVQMKLFFLLAAVLCSGTVAGFGQSRAALTIGGTVLPQNSLSFALRPGYDSTTLVTGAANPKVLGVVIERSNHQLGYTVSLESANASAGTGNGSSKQLHNIVRYDSLAVNLTNGRALLSSASGKTPRAGYSRNLTVTSPAGDTDNPGDTLTLTITAN